jgi:hypothetical protein
MDPTEQMPPIFPPEDGNRSNLWNTEFFRIPDDGKRPKMK